jgi:hypothetical protein
MAIRNAPKNGSTAGAPAGEAVRRDLVSLSLAPVKQGLSFYAEINRSILDTFLRLIPWGLNPFGAVSERNGRPSAASVEPATAPRTRTAKAAKTGTAVKRPVATERPGSKAPAAKGAAATKRPTAKTAAATKRPTATKPAAATKRATAKPAAVKAAAKRPAAAPPAPRRATGQSAPQKPSAKTTPKPAVKTAGRGKTTTTKDVASSRPRRVRASAAKKA